MKRCATFFLSAFCAVLSLTHAHAAGDKLWVASNGSSASTSCSYAAPCQSLQQAVLLAGSGSEINCVDNVAAAGALIDRPLTINCEGVLATNGQKSSTAAVDPISIRLMNANDTVVLRGLQLNFVGSQQLIAFYQTGTLVLDRVHIGGSALSGVLFAPDSPAHLIVKDSMIDTNGSGGVGAGVRVVPSGTGSALVTLERVAVTGNVFGVAIDGTNSTAGINATISNSTMSSHVNDGIIAVTSAGHAPIGVTVADSRSINNAYGIRSIGPNVTVRVDNSKVIGNGTGLAVSGGAALLSAGNNTVEANGTNGVFTGSFSLK
jgi:hypothetical protein